MRKANIVLFISCICCAVLLLMSTSSILSANLQYSNEDTVEYSKVPILEGFNQEAAKEYDDCFKARQLEPFVDILVPREERLLIDTEASSTLQGSSIDSFTTRVLLYVNLNLYPSIEDKIDRYIQDVEESLGYRVDLHLTSGGTA